MPHAAGEATINAPHMETSWQARHFCRKDHALLDIISLRENGWSVTSSRRTSAGEAEPDARLSSKGALNSQVFSALSLPQFCSGKLEFPAAMAQTLGMEKAGVSK